MPGMVFYTDEDDGAFAVRCREHGELEVVEREKEVAAVSSAHITAAHPTIAAAYAKS